MAATASILKLNSCCFLNPFGSHNLTPQSVKIIPNYGLSSSSSLQIFYKEIKGCLMTNYICRSQLGTSFTPPASETKRAFISVYDKTNLAFLGSRLHKMGYTIVSIGGTASALEKAGVPLADLHEIIDSHVNERDQRQSIDEFTSGIYDVVVVNSYTSYDGVSSLVGVPLERGAELIYTRGFLRTVAATTDHEDALIVVDPQDYCSLLAYLEENLEDRRFRRILALKALQHGTAVVSSISERLIDKSVTKVNGGGIAATAVQYHGKEMSCENYMNANAAWNCVSDFADPACVVVKHMNPYGVASRDDILEAYKLAIKADRFSSYYGGIVAFNVEVDEALASQMREFRSPLDGQKIVLEVVVAPSYSQKGLEILRGMSKNLRVLGAKKNKKEVDELSVDNIRFRIVSDKCPTNAELDDVKFAWLCVKHGMSNDIVVAKNKCMLVVARGLPNHLESGLRIAMEKAGEEAKGAILASDAFFPSGEAWKEAVNKACESGVTAIVAPGGSIGDEDAIQCCNNYGVSLLFTEVSHFRR